MSKENKIEYPCTDCEEDENDCNRQSKYLRCYKWRSWFHLRWEEIRKLFGFNVSERHNEKGSDLNE